MNWSKAIFGAGWVSYIIVWIIVLIAIYYYEITGVKRTAMLTYAAVPYNAVAATVISCFV